MISLRVVPQRKRDSACRVSTYRPSLRTAPIDEILRTASCRAPPMYKALQLGKFPGITRAASVKIMATRSPVVTPSKTAGAHSGKKNDAARGRSAEPNNARLRQNTTPTAYGHRYRVILCVFTVVFAGTKTRIHPRLSALETIAARQRRGAHRLVHEKYQNHRRTAQSAIVSVKRAPQGSASPRNNFSSGNSLRRAAHRTAAH